jgi:hypothetical protein
VVTDLERTYSRCLRLLDALETALDAAADTKEVCSIAEAFRKASGELRQLSEALTTAARAAPPEQRARVLAAAVAELPTEAQLECLRELRALVPVHQFDDSELPA